jgi:hypothetical protein
MSNERKPIFSEMDMDNAIMDSCEFTVDWSDDGRWMEEGWKIASKMYEAVLQDAYDAAAEVDAAGGDAPHAPALGLGPWIRARFKMEKP